MRGKMSTLERDFPNDVEQIDQVVRRLTTTARLAKLDLAGDILEEVQRSILAHRLSPKREN